MDNNTLGLKYYAYMEDAPLFDLLRKDNIETNNQLMAFSNYSWKYCPETGTSTGSNMIFYQCGPIHHGTHVPVPVAQSGTKLSTMQHTLREWI